MRVLIYLAVALILVYKGTYVKWDIKWLYVPSREFHITYKLVMGWFRSTDACPPYTLGYWCFQWRGVSEGHFDWVYSSAHQTSWKVTTVLTLIIRTGKINYWYSRLALNRKQINLAHGLFECNYTRLEYYGDNEDETASDINPLNAATIYIWSH